MQGQTTLKRNCTRSWLYQIVSRTITCYAASFKREKCDTNFRVSSPNSLRRIRRSVLKSKRRKKVWNPETACLNPIRAADCEKVHNYFLKCRGLISVRKCLNPTRYLSIMVHINTARQRNMYCLLILWNIFAVFKECTR